jgi:hypothetical protein
VRVRARVRMQEWSLTSILDEYTRYAGTKVGGPLIRANLLTQ